MAFTITADTYVVPRAPRVRSGALLTSVACVLAVVLVSRGVFEVVTGKAVGYVAQGVAAAGLVALVLMSGRSRVAAGARVGAGAYYVLALAALASGAVTLLMNDTRAFFVYIGVTLVIAGLMVLVSSTVRTSPRLDLGPVVVVTMLLLVGVALLQQFGGFETLPGSDRASLGGSVRPASLTGSYLHYPLCVAVLAFMSMAIHRATRKRLYLVVAVLGGVAVVLSYSRSGMLVMALGVLLVGIYMQGFGTRLRAAYLIVVSAIVGYVAFGGSSYFDRALSAVATDGAGNISRFEKWDLAVRMWLDSPLVVGRYTGEVTNSTGNLVGADSFVVESGVLQQLLNFGLLGALAFYVVMWRTVAVVRREHVWARAGLAACVAQTFVYQSVEVLPYMALFALAPAMLDRVPGPGVPQPTTGER